MSGGAIRPRTLRLWRHLRRLITDRGQRERGLLIDRSQREPREQQRDAEREHD